MAKVTNITTGEQAISSTGAVTGTLDTSALTGDYTVKVRVRGLASGKKMQVVIEDTANSSAFSDATQPASMTFTGGGTTPPDGAVYSFRQYQMPSARFGAANTKFRANVQLLDSSPGSPYLIAWLEQ